MKGIILAAGEGNRLKPLTDEKPKGLIELFGKSLLEWQIEKFRKCGINEIAIVTGYRSEKINFRDITYFHNKYYDKTNMVESLMCAREFLTDDVIVTYADIIFENRVLQKLIESESGISIIVDKNWAKLWKQRFSDPLNDAESLVIDQDDYISDIGQKVNNIDEICAQYIGLMKFAKHSLTDLLAFYDQSKNNSKTGKNPLNPLLIFEKSFMTDFLQGLIKNGKKISPVIIENGWLELDSIKDYELYNKMNSDGSLSRIFNKTN